MNNKATLPVCKKFKADNNSIALENDYKTIKKWSLVQKKKKTTNLKTKMNLFLILFFLIAVFFFVFLFFSFK